MVHVNAEDVRDVSRGPYVDLATIELSEQAFSSRLRCRSTDSGAWLQFHAFTVNALKRGRRANSRFCGEGHTVSDQGRVSGLWP